MPITKATTNVINLDKDTLIAGMTVGNKNILTCTALGVEALKDNNSQNNTAVGSQSLWKNTTGEQNTAIGSGAMKDSTTGNFNVAVGDLALLKGGSWNTAIGSSAGTVSTGNQNTIVGSSAYATATSGSNNTAVGYLAIGLSNSTASFNTAVGAAALQDATTGGSNVAVGYSALTNNTTGQANVCVGRSAGALNATGSYNVYLGQSTAATQEAGSFNTFCGPIVAQLLGLGGTTQNGNVGIGHLALDLHQTASNCTAIGKNAMNDGVGATNCSALGYLAVVTGDNQVQLGNSATTTYVFGSVQSRSDIRDKTEIRDTEIGLDFINSLRPVDFKWDMREDYKTNKPDYVERPIEPTPPKEGDNSNESLEKYNSDLEKYNSDLEKFNQFLQESIKWQDQNKLKNITTDGSKKRNRFHHGLIAQEVKAVLDAKGIDFGGYQDHSIKGGDDVLSIGYEELIAPLIKSIQELSAEVASLKSQLNP